MTSQGKTEARQRTEMLATLRSQHNEAFKRAQALLKEQQSIRKSLRQALLGGARSVPQLAEIAGIPASAALWHVAAMKKYGLLVEASMDEDGDYYLYELSAEARL
jgi:ferric-dicitrate binding protein FerR (iron transport regulator)